MNWVTGLLVYTVTWWLVLFCVLPIGIQRTEQVEAGNDPGAPKNPRLLLKVIATSAIAAVVFLTIFYLVQTQWISFRE